MKAKIILLIMLIMIPVMEFMGNKAFASSKVENNNYAINAKDSIAVLTITDAESSGDEYRFITAYSNNNILIILVKKGYRILNN